MHEGPQEEGTELSAELSSEGILDDRNEEKRITEADKNERVQRQLMTLTSGLSQARDEDKWTHNDIPSPGSGSFTKRAVTSVGMFWGWDRRQFPWFIFSNCIIVPNRPDSYFYFY